MERVQRETYLEILAELDEIRSPLIAFRPEDGLFLLGKPLLLAADEITESRDNSVTSGLRSS
jgi:hypothetical protein